MNACCKSFKSTVPRCRHTQYKVVQLSNKYPICVMLDIPNLSAIPPSAIELSIDLYRTFMPSKKRGHKRVTISAYTQKKKSNRNVLPLSFCLWGVIIVRSTTNMEQSKYGCTILPLKITTVVFINIHDIISNVSVYLNLKNRLTISIAKRI